MLKEDFARIIGRIWDPTQGGFDRKYFTEARITTIWEIFRNDSEDLFATVVDTVVRKFRTTPTVEQFETLGAEIRAKRREKAVDLEKRAHSEAANFARTTFKDYVKQVVSDPAREDELKALIKWYGMPYLDAVIEGRPLRKGSR